MQNDIYQFFKRLRYTFLLEKALNYALLNAAVIFAIIFIIRLLSVVIFIESPYIICIPFVATALILFLLHFLTSVPDIQSFIFAIDRKTNSGELLITVFEIQKSGAENPFYELIKYRTNLLISKIDSSVYSVPHKKPSFIFCVSLILFVLSNFLPSQNGDFKNSKNSNLITILDEIKNALPQKSQIFNQVNKLANNLKTTNAIPQVQELESVSRNISEKIEMLHLADKLKSFLKPIGFNENFSEKEIDNFIKENVEKIMKIPELQTTLSEYFKSSASSAVRNSISQILKTIPDKNFKELSRLLSQILNDSKISPEKRILLKINLSELNNFIFNVKNNFYEKGDNEYSSSSVRADNIDIDKKNGNNMSVYKIPEGSNLVDEETILQKINLPDDYKKILKKVYSSEEGKYEK